MERTMFSKKIRRSGCPSFFLNPLCVFEAAKRLRLIGVAALAGSFVACVSVHSSTEVMGAYVLSDGNQKITLDLRTNGTFSEAILFNPARTEVRQGEWHWKNGWLSLEGLWIPASFAPDYIQQADSKSGSGQPKYSEPGHWAIKPEKHWGKMVLPVFPDGGIEFKMVRHF
jgi:hypothetical protein